MVLLTTTQAARELGVSARSLAKWAQEGRLMPALVTPGGDLRDQLLKLRTRPE